MKLLIIEDEEDLLDTLLYGFRKKGFVADGESDGKEGLLKAQTGSYDLIVLDLNLPSMDGIDILNTIRKHDKQQKILILSARSTIAHRIEGLDLGANDYLVKPFDFGELVARVKNLTRRRFIQEDAVIVCSGLSIDTIQRSVFSANGEEILLATKEYMLLEYLLLNRGCTISAEELIEHVWKDENGMFSNSIKVHMSQLRKKLRPYIENECISTVRGMGYLIKEEEYQ